MMMNFLDLGAASEEERRIIREILSDTSVVNIAEPNKTLQHKQQSQQPHQQQNLEQQQLHQSQSPQPQSTQLTNNNPQANHHQQHLNGPRQSYKISQSQQHQKNFSNSSNNSNYSTNNSSSANVVTQNHRNNNYNNQRKNIHNNSNNVNSINNNSNSSSSSSSNNASSISGSNTKSSIKPTNLNNITGGVINNVQQQQHYPQQYTPPLPSNVSSQGHYLNSHGANALNSQLNTRTNKQNSNDRLRNSGLSNHINNNTSNSNNDMNIVVTSSSGPATLVPNLDQLHASSMSMNTYNLHTNQVPSVLPTAKIDPKSSGNSISLKSQSYHPQDTSNSIQNSNSGVQTVPSSAQMPPMPGDTNTVIGMDMTSAQPPGYAIPPHVTAYSPPAHHLYGGPPIFQPYHYVIHNPYNMPPFMPYVIAPNSVVPPSRQQVPPQSNQPPSSSTTTTTPRSHSYHISHQPNHNYSSATTSSSSYSKSNKEVPNKNSTFCLDHDLNVKIVANEKGLADDSNENTPELTRVPTTNTNSTTSTPTPLIDSASATPIVTTTTSTTLTTSSNVSTNLTSSVDVVTATSSPQTENISPLTISQPEKAKRISGDESVQELNSNLETKSNSRQQNTTSGEKPTKTHSTSNIKSNGVSRRSPPSVVSSTNRLSEGTRTTMDKDSRNEVTVILDTKNTEPSPQTSIAWGPAASKSWADLFKSEANGLQHSTVNGDFEAPHSGSDISDEENKDQRSPSSKIENAVKSTGGNSLKENRSQEAAKRASDKMAPKLAQKINSINLKHSLPFLKPRGFINKGNGCYINATLQALIACPPFYNLMKEIGVWTRDDSCTPILDSFADLFLNFPPLDASKKNKQSSQDQKININYLQADAIEPKCIYNVLGHIKSECLKGAQEDAEEFLSSVLNGLHEEMVGLGEIIQETGAQNGHRSDFEDSNDDIANDDNLWREVGTKNRSLPIRTAKVINTPIQEIFGGSLFSIRTAGKDRCGHRSPFFSLQLDITGDNVKSVQDAIKSFTATEVIHDFYCSKTKQKLDAQRRTSLDQLPPILILHLKQFVYTQDYGLKKLMKTIEYPIDFELPENCLHEKTSADRNLRTSRSYKLLAVVYHDGKEAIKGHYLTDVYHIGSSQWIRCDDSNLKVIPAPRIENPDSSRTPYLLFYRRLNTLRAQTSNHDNKKKDPRLA